MPPRTRTNASADADIDPNEQVAITHPDVDANGLCTRRQFRDLWEGKGWTIVEDLTVEDVVAEQVEALASVTENPEG